MAFRALFMIVMMSAVVRAGFSPRNEDEFSPFSSKMFRFVPRHSFPILPQFPNFPTLSRIPSLPIWSGTNNFSPLSQIPTFEDIAKRAAQPGTNYNGAAVITQSSSSVGPDGKVQKLGGSTVLLNDNGKFTVHQIGNSPPVVVTQYANSPFPDFPEIKFHHFNEPHFNIPTMKPFTFKPIKIPPIDPDRIRNFKPGDNEQFKGSFHSVSIHSSNVNGVRTSGGKIISVDNDNGKVNEENIGFHKGPK